MFLWAERKQNEKQNQTTTNGEETTKKILRVGIDPYVFASSFNDEFNEAMKEAAEKLDDGSLVIGELVTSHPNLIDPIWGDERPPIPHNAFRVHPLEYAGMSVADKVKKIREEMKELLLKRIIDRKNRVAATDEFVTKERDYTKDDGIMIGVW